MLIEKIVINNFRVYKGLNELSFVSDPMRNVSVIAGENGFGKTSLLTSLVWCFYGKLMADVDDRYRSEIYESGGYKSYCDKAMNRQALEENQDRLQQLKEKAEKVNAIDKRAITQKIKELQSFSVAIHLTKLFIPSLPCDEVIIKRVHNVTTHQEEIHILIDGRVNELAQNVGEDIFINDFVLPKEIAKFFFFDAERIVSLAEIRTTEEKKGLSQAYAEVLGIKKYHDLKENLQNLRLRLRKKSSGKGDREKLDNLKKQLGQTEMLISHINNMIGEKREELALKKVMADKLQEQLIREGSTLSLEDVKDFKKMRENLDEEGRRLKVRLQDMMEVVPFAIVATKFKAVKAQLEEEHLNGHSLLTNIILEKKVKEIAVMLKAHKKELGLDAEREKLLLRLIKTNLLADKKADLKTLLHFSSEQFNRFMAIYNNLTNAFNKAFRQLIADQKKQQSALYIIQRKLQDAETKEKDAVINTIRQHKTEMEDGIGKLEEDLINLEAQKIQTQHESNSIAKVLAELTKVIKVEDADAGKDQAAERLIGELTQFIHQLKIKKKASLQNNILLELNRLMHKKTFISKAEVIIEGDLIDIELLDGKGKVINKDSLSKGEQQLYATALLKALISESNIQFPVFIDSPLQKFDKEHAKNIITEFYPYVAGQVILFPLLEKELNEEEYGWLLPKISNTYLIENKDQYHSGFTQTEPQELFVAYRKRRVYVH